MALNPGTRLGPYEILSALGAGGMGEVYRARDTKLNRDVALKVLPDSFASDPDRLIRFQREAQVLASLNHPNIAHVYGLEENGGVRALVMELVEGEDLAQRIGRGAIPIDEALPIAKQVAEALEAAHEQGIIHRDLKPANIKVRSDGTVKVLDFGLAKAMDTPASSPNVSQSPTITTPAMTQAGMILGTAAYMSPEQASGKPVDKRADIWAFGCVVYEMLTGRRAFEAEDVAHALASVLKDEPNWALPSDTPPPIRRLLRRCLEKDRKRRLESAADVRLEIEDALASPAFEQITPRPVRRIALIAIAGLASGVLLAALVGFGLATRLSSRTSSDVPTRWALRLPRGVNFPVGLGFTTGMAVSPDGRTVALGAEQGGRTSVWVQTLNAVDPRPVAGTENFTGFVLFWSSDSQRLGFVADGKLKTIELATGDVRTLCDAPVAVAGGTWNKAGLILLGMSGGGIVRVPETGGDPVPVTKPDVDRQETIHRYPSFLPDGRHFLFLIQPNNTVAVGDVDSSEITRLFEADSFARYATEKFVLFVRQGALVAQPFDAVRLRMTGEAVTVAEGVPGNFQGGTGAFSVSDNGVLVVGHGAGGVTRLAHLTWFDRSGKVLGPIGESVDYLGIEASPDGRRIATHQHELIGGGDIWIRDAERDTNTRLTAGGHNTGPVWSPDGTRIAFGSNRPPSGAPFRDPYAGTFNLYEKPADADPATPPTLLLDSATANLPIGWKQPTSWSRDGKYIVFEALNPRSAFDIYLLTLEGDHKVQPLLQTQFQEFEGQISPDGRWLAYTSDETLRQEVYVRPLTDVGSKRQISKSGGKLPSMATRRARTVLH